jgi:hypothetical protein
MLAGCGLVESGRGDLSLVNLPGELGLLFKAAGGEHTGSGGMGDRIPAAAARA